MNNRIVQFMSISLLFLFLSCVYHYPLYSDPLHSAFYGQHDDVQFFFMVVGWFYHAMSFNPGSLFQLPIFFPYENALTFSEPLIGEAVLGWPFYLFTESVPFVFNVLTVLAAWLTALATFFLIRALTADRIAAFLAGVIMLSPPQHFSELAHIQSLQIQWLPLFFYSLYHCYKNEKWRWAFGIALSATFLLYSNLYYAVFLFLVSLFFFPVFVFSSLRLQRVKPLLLLAVSLLLVLLAAFPLITAYTSATNVIDFDKGLEEIENMSADVLDYLSSSSWLYYSVTGRWMQTEGHFPGISVLVLWGFGLLYLIRNWSSVHTLERAFFLASLGGAFGALLFSFGPVVKLGGQPLFATPYAFFYHYIPGIDAIRAVSRLGIFFHFFVVIGASFGIAALLKRYNSKQKLMAFLFLFFIILETFPPIHRAPVQRPPEPNEELVLFLKKLPPNQGVLHIPVYSFLPHNSIYEWWATFHWQPIVVAHSSNYPPDIVEAAQLLAYFPSFRSIEMVKAHFPVRYIVLHSDLIDHRIHARMRRLLKDFPEVTLIRQYGNDYVYSLKRTGKGPELNRVVLAERFGEGPLEMSVAVHSPLPDTRYVLTLRFDSQISKEYPLNSDNNFTKNITLNHGDFITSAGAIKVYDLHFSLRTEYEKDIDSKEFSSMKPEDFSRLPLNLSLVSQPFHPKRKAESSISVNGSLHSSSKSGFLCARIDPLTGKLIHLEHFDTHADPDASARLLDFIATTPADEILAGVVCDDAAAQLNENVDAYFRSVGIDYEPSQYYRWAFAFIIWGQQSDTPHGIFKAERKRITLDFGVDPKHFEIELLKFGHE